jgi:hypothetical protein
MTTSPTGMLPSGTDTSCAARHGNGQGNPTTPPPLRPPRSGRAKPSRQHCKHAPGRAENQQKGRTDGRGVGVNASRRNWRLVSGVVVMLVALIVVGRLQDQNLGAGDAGAPQATRATVGTDDTPAGAVVVLLPARGRDDGSLAVSMPARCVLARRCWSPTPRAGASRSGRWPSAPTRSGPCRSRAGGCGGCRWWAARPAPCGWPASRTGWPWTPVQSGCGRVSAIPTASPIGPAGCSAWTSAPARSPPPRRSPI